MSILSIVLTLSFAYSAPLYGDTAQQQKGLILPALHPQEIAVAEANMLAMGGYTAWDQTCYIT